MNVCSNPDCRDPDCSGLGGGVCEHTAAYYDQDVLPRTIPMAKYGENER